MGTTGIMRANNFLIPHSAGRHGRNAISVHSLDGTLKTTEHVREPRGLSTYQLQLLYFCNAVRAVKDGKSSSTAFANTGAPIVAQAALLDDAYTRAGMHPRIGPSQIVR
jgi:hypothetical protein